MVRRRLTQMACAVVLAVAGGSCARESDMAEHMEMPDTMLAVRAMSDEVARDSILDVMPGGEMARGDSVAEKRLLGAKR